MRFRLSPNSRILRLFGGRSAPALPAEEPWSERSADLRFAGALLCAMAVAGFAVHPAVGAGAAMLLALLDVMDWRARPSSLAAAFLAVILLVPADLRIAASIPFDLTADRLALGVLFLAGFLGLLDMPPEPLPAQGRGAGMALTGIVVVGLLSLAANAGAAAEAGDALGIKGLVLLVGYVIAFFLTSALASDRESVDRILRVGVMAGALVGMSALVERVTQSNPLRRALLALPAVSGPEAVDPALARGSVVRVEGTAEHPIAFGGAMAMLLPVALHLYFTSTGTRKAWWGAATCAIGGGMLMSVSRSSLIAAVMGFAVLLLVWPKRRASLVAAGVVALFAVHMLAPGLLGAFRSTLSPSYLIKSESSDNPHNRFSDYERVREIVPRKPLLGIGYDNFTPERYFYLDNQILKLLIELGAAGIAMMALFVARIARLEVRAVRDGPTERGHLSGALLASLTVFCVLSAFFDTFAFVQVTYMFFMLAALGVRVATIETWEAPAEEPAPGIGSWRAAPGHA